MKKMRRFAAIAAAAAMTACMAVPMTSMFSASAAATVGSITFTGANAGTHTYTAYRVFTGVAENNGFGTTAELKDVQWDMTADNAATFLSKLQRDSRFDVTTPVEGGDPVTANVFKDKTTAAAVAGVISGFTADQAKDFAEFVVENKSLLKTSKSSTMVEGVATIKLDDNTIDEANGDTTTDDGYYVIEETALENGGSMTAYLLGVYDAGKGAEVAVKTGTVTFQKKIMDKNDSDADTTKTADGSTNGVWQDSADYDIGDAVPFQLTATLPEDYANYEQYKLVFHDDLKAITVNEEGVEVTKEVYNNPKNFVVYIDADADGVKDTTDPVLTSEIEYKVNTSATAHNNYDCDIEVTLANMKAHDTTKTLAAGTKIVVEYEATLTKDAVIGSGGNWNGAYLQYSNNPYYTGDTDTLSKTEEDIVVAFTYQVSVDKVDGSDKKLPGAGFTLYKYDSTKSDYVEVEKIAADTTTTTFTFVGIDAGKYKLVESEIPDGYNKADDLEFVVKAEHVEEADTPSLTTLKVYNADGTSDLGTSELNAGKFVVTTSDGKLATKVVNNSGQTLPSTGGIGTTLFYVIGGTLAAGAGVGLIAKKRMKNEE